jgi:hypothetical protein
MEVPNISQDDLLDVSEMMHKIEDHLILVLQDNEMHLAMSALISACINCMLGQCKSLDEVAFYRNLFVTILDSAITTIKVKEPKKKKPPSF